MCIVCKAEFLIASLKLANDGIHIKRCTAHSCGDILPVNCKPAGSLLRSGYCACVNKVVYHKRIPYLVFIHIHQTQKTSTNGSSLLLLSKYCGLVLGTVVLCWGYHRKFLLKPLPVLCLLDQYDLQKA